MATTSLITGRVPLPSDDPISYAELTFTLSGLDSEGSDVFLPGISKRVVLVDSEIPAGFDLWRNTEGYRGTHYKVLARWVEVTRDGKRDRYAELPTIQVGDEASYTLAELLMSAPFPMPETSYWMSITEDEYNAAIAAAAAASADAAAAEAALATLSALADNIIEQWTGDGTVGPFELSADPIIATRVAVYAPVRQFAGDDFSIVSMAVPSGKGLQFVTPTVVGATYRAVYSMPIRYDVNADNQKVFASRALMIAFLTANPGAIASGTVVWGGDLAYRMGNTTPIADAPGLAPNGPPYADHWAGNTAPGTTDMRAAIVAGLAYLAGTGISLRLRGANAVSAMITIPDHTGLEFDEGSSIVPLASGFTNTDPAVQRNTATSCVLNFSGETSGAYTPAMGQALINARIISSLPTDRFVTAVRADNCKDFTVSGYEVTGTGIFKGIAANSLSGDWLIENVFAHDIVNSNAPVGATSSQLQITGVEIDQSRVDGMNSHGGTIRHIRGKNLMQAGPALAAIGYQSDVLNNNGKGERTHVHDVYGEDVGEVVDWFAVKATGGGFRGLRTKGSVCKLIHGAQYNIFHGVQSEEALYQAVSFTGANDQDTAYNQVHGVISDLIDVGVVVGGGYSTACIRFMGSGPYLCHDNIVTGADLNPGADGKWAVGAEATTFGNAVHYTRMLTGSMGIVTGSAYVALHDMTIGDDEYGSVANGRYVKRGNGVLECWHIIDETAAAWDTASGSLFARSAALQWTFPVAFYDVPEVTASAQVNGAMYASGCGLRSVSTGNAQLHPWCAVTRAATSSKFVRLHAIGRWKA